MICLYEVKLEPVLYREIIFARFFQKDTEVDKCTVIIDSGCPNSLIPLKYAKRFGQKLPFKRLIKIAGNEREAILYSLDGIKIGDFILNDVIMYAANFIGELEDSILLGLNVLNNWKRMISRKDGLFCFEEDLCMELPNKINPYRNYFNEVGDYVMLKE